MYMGKVGETHGTRELQYLSLVLGLCGYLIVRPLSLTINCCCYRVAANGDTANKIGTFQIAVVAKHHDIPFYIAAPSTSIDLNISSGRDIVIEERPTSEMTCIAGVQTTANGRYFLSLVVLSAQANSASCPAWDEKRVPDKMW